MITLRNASTLGVVVAIVLSVYAVYRADRAENIALGRLAADVTKAQKKLGDTATVEGG